MNKGKNTIKKTTCHHNLIQFSPEQAKKYRCFNFLYFHNYWNLSFGPTKTYNQEWNFLVVRGWWLKVSIGWQQIIFFLLLWCHHSLQNVGFHDSGYVILYPQPRSTTDRYPSFIGHQIWLTYSCNQ